MRNLFYILLSFVTLSCVQPKNEISNAFFENSDFIEIYEVDTAHLSFLDTTYSLLTKNGIQHKDSWWSIKTLGTQQLLLLGKHYPRVFQIINFTDTSCTLLRLSQTEETPFILFKEKKEDINVQGIWKSFKIPPPPVFYANDPELSDSIFANRALWESEIFEFTKDSIRYSFYDYKIAVKFEKPFIQLEKDLRAANGRLSVLRPITQDDSTLTLEFYYTDGNHSSDYENKKWVRKLKTVANKK